MNELPSERVVLSSPLSFSGSARRIWRLRMHPEATWKRRVVNVLAATLIGIVWILIAVWYTLMLTVLLIPFLIWRFHRRNVRKDRAEKLRHREILDHQEEGRNDG
jgi:C4-dicarboxylate-specific signal transduction histidine kinase